MSLKYNFHVMKDLTVGTVKRESADADRAAASMRIDKFLSEFPASPSSENGKISVDRDEMYGRLFRRFETKTF